MEFEITPEDLKSSMDNGQQPTLLDIREPWEYAAAHIEGSKHIPMNELPLRTTELDPGTHIVVICHSGVRSAHVTEWLRQNGYDKVQSLRGGIDRWSRFVDPRVPIY